MIGSLYPSKDAPLEGLKIFRLVKSGVSEEGTEQGFRGQASGGFWARESTSFLEIQLSLYRYNSLL
jgi:hypothetical protein